MRNKHSNITEEQLTFLNIIGEEIAKVVINKVGPIKISLYSINNHLKYKEIAKSLESNKPVNQIAKEVGVHKTTVYRHQKKMRIKK